MTEQVPVTESRGEIEQSGTHPAEAKDSPYSTRPRRAYRRLLPPDISREEALRRLETFYQLSRVFADSENNVTHIAQAVAELTSTMIGDMSVVTLLNTDSETYHIAAYHDPDPEVIELYEKVLDEVDRIPRSQGWVARVINTGQPLLIPAISVEEAERVAVPAFVEFARRVGVAGILIVPIMGRSGVLGAIALTRHHGGKPYHETNQSFLMEIGYRTGLAIESATLVDSLRKEVAARLFAREALAASEERFLSIFRSAPLGIKVMDLVGGIIETNDAFQSMCGCDESELIGTFFYDMIHPDDTARVLEAFGAVKTNAEAQPRVEHRLCRSDRSVVWVRTTFAGVKKSGNDPALSLILGITEDVSERKQADAELLELKQHLQHSIELERLRLAQNLHDTPMQELYAVIYRLEELRPTTRPATSEIIGQVIADIKKTLDGLRSTASELRPPALSKFGLERAIRSYVEDFRQKHPDLRLELMLSSDRLLLPEDVRLVLFRVFQEAMANVARHAQATEVKVRFSFDAEQARLEVSDNGQGFVVPPNWISTVREGHYGLAGMAERVSAARGVLTLESQPQGPTTVRAVIPCA